jgi:hypothetical protein
MKNAHSRTNTIPQLIQDVGDPYLRDSIEQIILSFSPALFSVHDPIMREISRDIRKEDRHGQS